ncbi:MAG TPA: SDR family oxidoreductase [Gemmatimonadales bacterium]|nr:SDR family oxidoreductase [Gemmatimonadales bacterium]
MTALAGRLALVTGASRGIGAAVVEAFAAAGATVVRVARSLEDGWHDGRLDIKADVSDAAQTAQMAERVRSEAGVPDIVVQSAGGFLLARLADTTPADFDQQVRVNLRAGFLVARELLPPMAALGRGTYVSVGSVADHVGFPENAAYGAAKYGLRGLHETLVAEYRSTGVRLSLVSPGPTDTAIWDPFDPDHRPGFPPRAAMLRPGDVADAVLFLATRPASVHVDWLRLGPV